MSRTARPARTKARYQIIVDTVLMTLSGIVALALVMTGVVHSLVTSLTDFQLLGSLFAGILFTSSFTTAPGIAMLGEIAQETSPLFVALWGGIGAAIGDVIMFRFMRDRFSEDMNYLLKLARARRLLTLLTSVRFRWLGTLVGGLIIASPLPDELGLTLLGMTKVRTIVVLPLTFILNAGGIYIIGEVARALQF